MNEPSGLGGFTLYLALLSLLAIGGVNVVLPDLYRYLAEHFGMSAETFVSLFALAQAAPGPNVIFVTLVGWQIGGLVGAAASTAAICGPALVVAYGAAHLSMRMRERPVTALLRRALAPVTAGLTISSAWLLTSAAAVDGKSYALTAAVALLVLLTRIHPLVPLAAAAVLGMAGLV